MAETGGHLVRNTIAVRDVDLNTMVNVGTYACFVSNTTEQHAPVAGETLLEVLIYRADDDVRWISQEIRGLSDFSRYTRTFDGDTWSAWTELAEGDGGGGAGATDLDFVRDATTVTVRSNTGTDAVLPAASDSAAGVMSAAQAGQLIDNTSAISDIETKLNGIEFGATGDQTGAEMVAAIDTELGSSAWRNTIAVVAEDVAYNNVSSGLAAENVQDAIDEVNTNVQALSTNLSLDRTATTAIVECSTGTNAEILAADASNAGVMTAADKVKLDAIESGAEVNVPTHLSVSRNATTVTVASDTGNDAVIPSANSSNAGVMSAADKAKLDAIESGADVNLTGAELVEAINTALGSTDWQEGGGGGSGSTNLSVSNTTTTVTVSSDTGTDAILAAADAANAGVMTATQAAKLAGIASGAQVNVPTNLSFTRNSTSVTVASDTGDDAVLPVATTSNAGVMSAADKNKLDGIQSGATDDMTGAEIVAAIDTNLGSTTWRGNGVTNLSTSRTTTTVAVNSDTGTDITLLAADSSNAGVMTAAQAAKLSAIENGATADMTGAEIVAAIDGNLGSTEWRNAAPGDSSTNASARVATTANITIATALNVGDVIDGVTLAEGDLVLVKDQSNATQNGIYVAGVSPERDARYDSFAELAGLLVTIQEGTVHDDEIWLCTSTADGTIGVNNVTFVETAVTPTNLSATRNSTTVNVNSSTGSSASIGAADSSNAGVMSAADKVKLDSLESGAQITDITISRTSTSVTVQSSDGDDGAIAAADTSNAGVMTAAMVTKLNGIEAGATGDQTGAEIISLLNASLGGTTWQGGGVGSPYTHPNHTGDVISVGDGATTITDGAVTNAKIATNAVTEAKIANSAVTSAKIATDAVDNTKLANMVAGTIKGRITTDGDPQDLTAAQVRSILNIADGANNYVHPNHTGDVTSTGDGATVIAVNTVTNAKLADMTAGTIKGRISTNGDPQDLSAEQVRTLLNVADGANAYTHPNHTGDVLSSGDGATTIAVGAVVESKIGAGAVTNGKIGDLAVGTTKIADSAVTTIKVANDAINNTKLANMAANTIKGAVTAGDPQDLTAAQVRTILGIEAGATADQTGAEMVVAINAALGGTTWQGGGGGSGAVASQFLGRSNATQTIAHASGTPASAKVLFQTEAHDPANTFSGSTSRWTPGVAGLVNLRFAVRGSHAHSSFTTWKGIIEVRKNGSLVQSFDYNFSTYNSSVNAGGTYMMYGHYDDVCDSDDYYEIWGYCYGASTGVGVTYYNGRFLSGSAFSGHVII